MDKKTCLIVGGSGSGPVYIDKTDPPYIMACDSGLKLLGDVRPDLAVGDFDSLGYVPKDLPVLFHKPEKDDTDVMLAVKRGFELGFTRFVLYGCMGGRIDHAYANYQVLAYIDSHGGRGVMAGDGWLVTMLTDGRLTLHGRAGEVFSFFAYGGNPGGVTIRGGKYPLDDYPATADFPIGVSNEFLSDTAEISVRGGSVLVMWQGDIKAFNMP